MDQELDKSIAQVYIENFIKHGLNCQVTSGYLRHYNDLETKEEAHQWLVDFCLDNDYSFDYDEESDSYNVFGMEELKYRAILVSMP